MTFPDPVGASLAECFIHWQQNMAMLRVRPRSNIQDLLVDLLGLVKLRLARGQTGGAQIQRAQGPTKTEAGWHLRLEFADGGLFEAEFTSLEFRLAAPGQRQVNNTDLYSRFREMLRTTIHALVIGDLHSIQMLPRIAAIKTLPYEIHEYPKNLVDPPPEADAELEVGTVGSDGGRWRIKMPLWTTSGRLAGCIVSMQIHRVDDDLIGYLEGMFTQ